MAEVLGSEEWTGRGTGRSMIGDDVPRFRRRSHCRPIAFVQHAWSRLQCLVYGHRYKPWHYQQGSQVQYECCCCGRKTPWMSRVQHDLFTYYECPTWGDRGSDSQGYRFVGPKGPPRKISRPGKKRKRYRKTA